MDNELLLPFLKHYGKVKRFDLPKNLHLIVFGPLFLFAGQQYRIGFWAYSFLLAEHKIYVDSCLLILKNTYRWNQSSHLSHCTHSIPFLEHFFLLPGGVLSVHSLHVSSSVTVRKNAG